MAGPVPFVDELGERLDRRRVGNISAHTNDIAVVAADTEFGDRALEHGLLDVGDHDLGPLFEEGLNNSAADAIGTAGNNGHTTG